MNWPQVYMYPPDSETPFHLPPHLGFPASYIKLPLAICFTDAYVSMLFTHTDVWQKTSQYIVR